MVRDLVGSTQEGVEVNKTGINHNDVIGQFCLNHGLHIEVCDTFYKKSTEMDNLNLDSDTIDEMDNLETGTDMEVISDDTLEGNVNYHDLLKKSCELVKFIKKLNCSK
ncbi:hypothetical protein ACJMK2_020978 [Sinanodonta woodiana]|uniref:Uncharacterized protein n=1 Tax=Sinanodonta woodiana TaxID=1069815 RepID=A0ABD3U167_SINWO